MFRRVRKCPAMYKCIHGNFEPFVPPPIRQGSGQLTHCVRSDKMQYLSIFPSLLIAIEVGKSTVFNLCTLGIFHAPAFAADFPPAAPEFYQRTHRVRLKNLGTTDKKSSRKIKYKKIPRVHLFMIMSPQDDISFYHDFLPLIMLDQSLGSQISHAFIFQFFTDSKNIL